MILVLATTTAITGAFAAPASATVVDHGHFVIEEQFPPTVTTDLPCLEGKEFLATGSAIFRGTVVDAGDEGFHFSQIEKFEGTLVSVDGQGPTYVESGSAQAISFNRRSASGVFTYTNVNNDNFIAFEDGKVVSAKTIRIHELYYFIATDTDGDGEPDTVKVEFSKPKFSCP
ncbi:MAG TPA: hypothetical protein VF086_02200 [Propionibacteriaceae bacterium]